MQVRTEQDLIERYIVPDAHKPGAANVRLAEYGVPVWALIAAWKAVDFDTAQVASDYELRADVVRAALAYYKQNQAVIDARLTLSAS